MAPGPRKVVPRERLFAFLDAAEPARVTWVASEAGSGKTTLAASYVAERRVPAIWYRMSAADADLPTFFHYLAETVRNTRPRLRQPLPRLTPEYLPAVEAFAKRFFDAMLSAWKGRFVIVLDEFQDRLLQSPLVELVKLLVSVLPPRGRLLVLSRNRPPAAFARHIALGELRLIGPAELRFTLEEARELAHALGCKDDALIAESVHRARGWAAGIVLLLQPGLAHRASGPLLPEQVLFDFFAAELYAQLEPQARTVLLRTAFVPSVTAQEASRLSGLRDAGQLLAKLTRDNAFMTHDARSGAYEYHPLFREFLLKHAESELLADDLAECKRTAAGVLEASGRYEPAAALYIGLADWDALGAMVLRIAPTLLSQGRLQLLHGWIEGMPPARVERSPDLLYWFGVSQIPFGPRQARRALARAYDAYAAASDPRSLLACCAVLHAYAFELGDFAGTDLWIERLETLLGRVPDELPLEMEIQLGSAFETVRWSRPDHPLLKQWIERARARIAHTPPSALLLAYAYSVLFYDGWMGDCERSKPLVALGRQCAGLSSVPLLFRLAWFAIEPAFLCYVGELDAARESTRRGERFMEELALPPATGLLGVTSAYYAICSGDPASGLPGMQRAAACIDLSAGVQAAHYHYVRSSIELALGNLQEARRLGERHLELANALHVPYVRAAARLSLAQILAECGDYERAEQLTAEGVGLARQFGSATLEMLGLLNRANVAFCQGRAADAAALLRPALSLARARGYVAWEICMPTRIAARLAQAALSHGVETAYVKDVIRRRRLVPEDPVSGEWPYPVRLRTFGSFELSGEAVSAAPRRKASRQPVALLKLLLAHGPRDVDGAFLARQLWGGSSPEDADNALSATLHRLRRLLGREDAVLRSGNRLSLNGKVCHWDVAEFERLLKRCQDVPPGEPPCAHCREALEHSLALYRGPFLGGDDELPGVAARRERLRQQFHAHIERAGRCLEAHGRWELAEAIYRQALQCEPLSEIFHRHLIRCLKALGRHAEAIDVYHRCRETLVRELGTAPSRATRALIDSAH